MTVLWNVYDTTYVHGSLSSHRVALGCFSATEKEQYCGVCKGQRNTARVCVVTVELLISSGPERKLYCGVCIL